MKKSALTAYAQTNRKAAPARKRRTAKFASAKRTVCPFTLEPPRLCSTRSQGGGKVCSFSLELCLSAR